MLLDEREGKIKKKGKGRRKSLFAAAYKFCEVRHLPCHPACWRHSRLLLLPPPLLRQAAAGQRSTDQPLACDPYYILSTKLVKNRARIFNIYLECFPTSPTSILPGWRQRWHRWTGAGWSRNGVGRGMSTMLQPSRMEETAWVARARA